MKVPSDWKALPTPVGGVSGITRLYVTKFGNLPAGSRVLIQTRQQANGWRDAFPAQTTAVVPGKPTSLVHPFYSRRGFKTSPASPPSPGPVLTAFVWPPFKGNRIFMPLQLSAALSSAFLPLDFGLWTFRLPTRPSAPPRPAPLPLPVSATALPSTLGPQTSSHRGQTLTRSLWLPQQPGPRPRRRAGG